MKMRIVLLGLLVLALAAVALVGCAQSQSSTIPPMKRTITMTAVEPKGGVTVDKEAFPKDALPAGGGYLLKAPDKDGRWEVSAYRWDPNQVIVNQGDEVTLEILGINGAEHPTVIEGYNVTFNVKRGQVTMVTFKADKAGVFKINCGVHQPSMVGELVVLAR